MVSGSTISGNMATSYAGGIFNYYGQMDLNTSTLIGNVSLSLGGGIYNWSVSTVVVSDCTLQDNAATDGAAIWNGQTLLVTGSTLIGNVASGLK